MTGTIVRPMNTEEAKAAVFAELFSGARAPFGVAIFEVGSRWFIEVELHLSTKYICWVQTRQEAVEIQREANAAVDLHYKLCGL